MEATQKQFPDFSFVKVSQIKSTQPEPGLTRRVGSFNDKLFLAEHRMIKGWVGSAHSHPHEQVVYVVQGRLQVTIAGETFELQSGESFVVCGGIEHQASALEDSVVIDVFTPCRHDYL